MTTELGVYQRLHEHGVRFVVNVPTVYGGMDLFLTPADLLTYPHDPEAVAAKHMGVTRDIYVEWLAAMGDVQCAGETKSGRRCRRSISGGSIYDPAEWARAIDREERCVLHGGQPGGEQ